MADLPKIEKALRSLHDHDWHVMCDEVLDGARRAIAAEFLRERAQGVEDGEGLSRSMMEYWRDRYRARAAAIEKGTDDAEG